MELKQKPEVDPRVASTVQNAVNFVNYQEGAVVSSAIVKKPGGNVTIFSFDEGQYLSEHTAPFDAMVYILDGETEIKISGNDYILKAGDMIVMPANEPHALRALKQFKMMLIMIKS